MTHFVRATLFSLCLAGMFFCEVNDSNAQLFRRFGCGPRVGLFQRGCYPKHQCCQQVLGCYEASRWDCCNPCFETEDCGTCSLKFDKLLRKYVFVTYCNDENLCLCDIPIPISRRLRGDCHLASGVSVTEKQLHLILGSGPQHKLRFSVQGDPDEVRVEDDILIPYTDSPLTKWVIEDIHYNRNGHAINKSLQNSSEFQYVDFRNSFDSDTVSASTGGGGVNLPVYFSDTNYTVEITRGRFLIRIMRVFDND